MEYKLVNTQAGTVINGKLIPAERVLESKKEVIKALVENELTYCQCHYILCEVIEELESKMGNQKIT